jgi:hypothetical protein
MQKLGKFLLQREKSPVFMGKFWWREMERSPRFWTKKRHPEGWRCGEAI